MAKILIIDDEIKLRDFLAHIVGLEGYEVVVADTCEGGLKKLEQQEIDAVLCDVKLPDGNGVQAIKNGAVEFSVKDFGKGIESKFKEKVFDRYLRIHGTNKEGSSLGLAISKEFIEAQGGKISLKSELGIGCEFKFVLPKA